MVEMTRDEVARIILQRLAEPAFRKRLSATTADGSHPIVVSYISEQVKDMLAQVDGAGGAANVAIPCVNGIMVLAVTSPEGLPSADTLGSGTLNPHCTVGVLLQRLKWDGGNAIYFMVEPSGEANGDMRPSSGRAELVALAG
jgi:hypothetical protein